MEINETQIEFSAEFVGLNSLRLTFTDEMSGQSEPYSVAREHVVPTGADTTHVQAGTC